jgi:S1-C subfamily serine protease
MDDVIRVVNDKEPGDEVTLELLRGSDRRTVKAKLGDRPADAQSSFPDQGGQQTPP